MPLQRSPRYPLRSQSQDILISPDLHTSHKTSVSSRSRMLDGNPQVMMPSLGDPLTQAVSGFYHNDKPLFEDETFVSHKNYLDWHNLHDAAMLFQDPNRGGPALSYSDSRFENMVGNSMPDQLFEQTLWDYATSYNIPSTQPNSSSTYPRGLSCADDIAMQDAAAPVGLTRSRLSYPTESAHHKYPTNLTQQRRIKIPGTNQRKGIAQPEGNGKTQHVWCTEPKLSTLPATKLEVLAVSSPDMNHGGEGGASLVNTNDAESDADASENAEPYAQLIYRALRDAPGYGMVLKDIYDWFEKNTDKAKNPSSKGWQNSIRHNLSMNGVSTRFLRCQERMLMIDRHSRRLNVSQSMRNPRKDISGSSSRLPWKKESSPRRDTENIILTRK